MTWLQDIGAAIRAALDTFRTRRYWRARGVSFDNLPF